MVRRSKSKEQAYVPAPKMRQRSRASYAKSKPARKSIIATAAAAGRKLVANVHENKTLNSVYRAASKIVGKDLNQISAMAGARLGDATSRIVRKKLDEMMKTDSPEAVFMPRAHGMSDSDAGTMATYGCCGNQSVAGRDIKRYAAGKKISAIYDEEMQAAAKLYKETSVITDVMGSQFRGQVYYNSGFNCKGFVEPVNSFIVLDTTNTNPEPVIARDINANANNYTMFFQTEDYYNTIMQSVGVIPPINITEELKKPDTDLFFAIRNLKLSVDIMNSNSYYPCQVKIFVLRAKTDLVVSDTPLSAYVGSSVTSQSFDRVNVGYLKYRDSRTMQGTTNTYSYTCEMSVLPQVTPAMSPRFKQYYDIVSVDKITLNPLDSLEYVLEKQIPHPTSYRQVETYRQDGVAVKALDYGLMIEFQGAQGIVMPSACISSAYDKSELKISEPVMGLIPTRLRVDTKKTADISAAAVRSTLNDIKALSSAQTTWINQRNFAPSVDTALTTFSYNQLDTSDPSTPTPAKYTIPVFTDEVQRFGGSISKDT